MLISHNELRGKRLLICEEALIDYKGHFYSWIKAIREIHVKAGAEVLVAGNQNVNREIKAEFDVLPVYTHNNWSGIYDYKQSWRRHAAVFLHNYRVWKQTRKLLRQIGPVDCIIVTSARIHHLVAWRRLCKESLGKHFTRVILFVLTSEAIYDPNFKRFHFKRTAAFIKKVLQGFKNAVNTGGAILAGDSHITCSEYHSLSGVPFKVFPSPGAGLQAPIRTAVRHQSQNLIPHFVILGVSVIDKGIDLLQEAIISLLEKDPELPAKFVIQWSTQTIDYDGKEVPISPVLRNAKQVLLLETVLDEEAYKGHLQQADFVVLPYRRKVYFNRISGVAVEAACAGIPMIVTENTWLSWAMNEYGAGVTVCDGDPKDLEEKIRFCIENRSSLASKAFEKKSVALELNSTERYLQCVWK